jgi:hypothetical protein
MQQRERWFGIAPNARSEGEFKNSPKDQPSASKVNIAHAPNSPTTHSALRALPTHCGASASWRAAWNALSDAGKDNGAGRACSFMAFLQITLKIATQWAFSRHCVLNTYLQHCVDASVRFFVRRSKGVWRKQL